MGLIDDKLLLIDNAEDIFKAGLIKADERLTLEILKIYTGFAEAGVLEFNALQMAGLDDALIRAIGATDYREIASSYLQNFESIEELNKQIMQSVNGISPELTGIALAENERIINNLESINTQLKATPTGVTTVVDIIDGQAVKRTVPYRNGSLDTLLQPLADIMRDDIIQGVSFDSAAERITTAITKNQIGLERWAKQISRDALSQQDGLINNEFRKEFSLDWVTYAGSIKETTRPFCYHVLKTQRVFRYDEAQEMYLNEYCPGGIPSTVSTDETANGKEQQKGNGMIPGTNANEDGGNFMIRRGGYNCRHVAIPTAEPGT